MTDREVMQQTLEALQYGKTHKAITILREALEQPEQQAEPVAWNAGVPPMWPQQKEGETFSVAYIAQPEQQAEPVAWTTMPEAEDWCFVSGGKDPTGKLEGKWFPLYTTPPKRPWQGLTEEEVKHLYPYGRSVWGRETFEAIEAALRSKNT